MNPHVRLMFGWLVCLYFPLVGALLYLKGMHPYTYIHIVYVNMQNNKLITKKKKSFLPERKSLGLVTCVFCCRGNTSRACHPTYHPSIPDQCANFYHGHQKL